MWGSCSVRDGGVREARGVDGPCRLRRAGAGVWSWEIPLCFKLLLVEWRSDFSGE